MKRTIITLSIGLLGFAVSCGIALAQGTAQISGTVKPVYEEEKKQKIILDYKILQGDAMTPQDCNIIIMVEYPNMAALDGLRDKMDPIIEKVMGSEDQRRATAVKRLDIREILGTKTMREITLK